MLSEIPLSEYGLMTVDEAAAARGWVVRTVQKWITDGLLPVVCAGHGKRGVYLLREKDVKAFTPPPRGRPAKEKPEEKPKGRGKRGKK
jgi:hypothetical protein